MIRFTVQIAMTAQVLRPNVKGPWRIKAKAVKETRLNAFYIFKQAISDSGIKAYLPFKSIQIKRTFYFNTKRRRDKDNMNASTKAINDGLVDSGLIADDDGENIVWHDSSIITDTTLKYQYITYEVSVVSYGTMPNPRRPANNPQ